MAPAPHRERGQRRAEQRCRAQHADLELPEAEREQIRRQHDGDEAVGERAQRAPREDATDHAGNDRIYVFILIGWPIAFQPEWPLFMYLASKPASRSLIAVLQPTWKPYAQYTTTGSDFDSSPIHCWSRSGSRHWTPS